MLSDDVQMSILTMRGYGAKFEVDASVDLERSQTIVNEEVPGSI